MYKRQVQSLYEKKLTTYPRTDSCYITDDDEEMLEELTEELEGFLDIAPEDVDEAVPRTRRTVNREKVTDHHAILPTRSMLQADLDALPKGCLLYTSLLHPHHPVSGHQLPARSAGG